jgi:hypothetical protein
MQEYESYEFSETLWFDFLKLYFEQTMRKPRSHQTEADPRLPSKPQTEEEELREDIANLVYNAESQVSGAYALVGKIGPRDPTGDDDCDCPSIKNYPHDTRALRERLTQAPPEDFVPISPGFFDKFV